MESQENESADPLLASTADRLHSAAIHLLRHVRQQDRGSGLSAPRLSALSVIVFRGPVTLKALAEAEQVRPPTMTRLVDELEQVGLVSREPSLDDHRRVLISATDAGKLLLQEGRSRRTTALARQLAGLTSEDLAVLHRAAEILDGVSFGPG